MSDETELIPFLVTAGFHGDANAVALRFPAEYEAEVRQLLDEKELEHNTALEFSAAPSLWIEIVQLLGPYVGVGTGLGVAVSVSAKNLAAVIKEVAHRHDGKRFVFDRDGSVEIAGLSEEKILEHIHAVLDQQAELHRVAEETMGNADRDEAED